LLQPATQEQITGLQQYFMAHGVPDPNMATDRAINVIGDTIKAQSTLMAYADCFALLGIMLIAAAGSIIMLKKGSSAAGGAH
jgi:DHA2 family multidrug resistance protein